MGRCAEIVEIERHLRMGYGVLVRGPCRTGKTVVAQEVLRPLATGQPAALTARVDLFTCSTLKDLAAKLTAAVLVHCHPAFKPGDHDLGAGN